MHGLWDLIRDATEAGELDLTREDLLFFATPYDDEVAVNSTRVTGVLGTSVWDLTRAELVAHEQMAQIVRFLRAGCPDTSVPTRCRAACRAACARPGASRASTR